MNSKGRCRFIAISLYLRHAAAVVTGFEIGPTIASGLEALQAAAQGPGQAVAAAIEAYGPGMAGFRGRCCKRICQRHTRRF